MTQRCVQQSVWEYECDECGRKLNGESTPRLWVNINVDRYDSGSGSSRKQVQLCNECGSAEKYAWTVSR